MDLSDTKSMSAGSGLFKDFLYETVRGVERRKIFLNDWLKRNNTVMGYIYVSRTVIENGVNTRSMLTWMKITFKWIIVGTITRLSK